MAFFRRFFSFINNNAKSNIESEVTGDVTIATYYLGQTYAAKPNSDELKRASHILMTKAKKDLEKNLIPTVYLCFESTTIFLRDALNHSCCEYDVRKIVMSCIDSRNQKLVAIFYDNASPYIGNAKSKSNMLECHLCLCKNKEAAKSAANQIGEMLSREYKLPSRQPYKKMEDSSVRLSKANYDDFDYENVNKFFQQKVFGLKESSVSSLSTPCGSVSTFATTTGCDSGCASTIASIDIRGAADDMSSVSSVREPTIDEHNEFNSSFEEDLESSILGEQFNFNHLQGPYNKEPTHGDKNNMNHEQTDFKHQNDPCSGDMNHDETSFQHQGMDRELYNEHSYKDKTKSYHHHNQEQTHTNNKGKNIDNHYEKIDIHQNEKNDLESHCEDEGGDEGTEENMRDASIYHNRYSVHYDLEDEDDVGDDEDDDKVLTSTNDDDYGDCETDHDRSIGLQTPELERLLDLGETKI